MPLEHIAFEIPRLLDKTLEIFRASALEQGVSLSSWVDPGLPRVLYGDPLRLRQVKDTPFPDPEHTTCLCFTLHTHHHHHLLLLLW